MLKLIGSVMVFGSCAALGLSARQNLRRRVAAADAMLLALGLIRSEISGRRTPMPEIVGLLAENEQPIIRKVFRTLQRRLREQNGLSLGYLWRSTLRDCRAQVGLGTQECDILCDAANYLGRYDADEQLTGLTQVERRLAASREAAQEDLVGATLEYIQGMGIVKSFNLGGKSNQKMKQAIEESRARNTKLETVFGPYGMVQLFVLRLASVAIMFCSILFYLQGSMTLVYCLLMCVASFLIFSELEAAGGKSFALRLIESSIDKVNAIDDTPVMDLSGKDIAPKDTTIELQNVGFSYGDHRILNHVNLTIPAKTTTAIVGPSGSGKTTLCSLITRFWDVDEGCIKLGGTDIREYKLDSLLSNISMVFQNVFLFADSIENNIKFGKPDATHEEVVRAAKSACCHDFIMALPNGYDTVIGESGATLSGGEKQRISIARAILKDTPIIILDEATSSVDPENEAELQQAIEKLTEDKTVIIIAHRLKTVRNAQQIVVVANGGIAQCGTHQELMTQPGIYADFVNIREKAVNWKISSSKIQQ